MKHTFQAIILAAGIVFSLGSCSDEESNSTSVNTDIIQSMVVDTVAPVNGEFVIPELVISPSPAAACAISFAKGEEVVHHAVSPAGTNVAVLLRRKGEVLLVFWQLGSTGYADSCKLPHGVDPYEVAWHPMANALFVLGKEKNAFTIYRVVKENNAWTTAAIFSSSQELKSLMLAPRPFITAYNSDSQTETFAYRLFFAQKNGTTSWRIYSTTESGKRSYQVVGPKSSITSAEELEADMEPSSIESNFAVPIAFHPAGHQLIWKDANNSVHIAEYQRLWLQSQNDIARCGLGGNTAIAPTPNGLGFIRWQAGKAGVGVFLIPTQLESKQLSTCTFRSMPISVPDGKGLVGVCKSDAGDDCLRYEPIQMPLADVLNAWMFTYSQEELSRFSTQFGLFRPNKGEQLYQLYDTENYGCGSFDRNSPTRPYLVTTDIFWELFAAAYQGLFIVKERADAIPAFWSFVNQSQTYFASSKPSSKWNAAFTAVTDFNKGNLSNVEAQHIEQGNDANSSVTTKYYYYSNLKPRGHYASSPEMSNYFKAFKYITDILSNDADAMKEIATLPTNIQAAAQQWMQAYDGFIAPSRAPLAWNGTKAQIPSYCKYPQSETSLFPLSWGFDNEVIYSTIYHQSTPKDLQVTGAQGPRILPSGLDIAAVFGNRFASDLLKDDLQKYPPLQKVISNLQQNFASNQSSDDFTKNLYNQWINTLAIQWADSVQSTTQAGGNNLWQAKRLQTGLASWATLRHATVLVNERGGAECGEGGFEELLMRAPRGYVEPDPYTFAAIANLFDALLDYVPQGLKDSQNTNSDEASLYDGIVARIKEAAQEARNFETMARKERNAQALTDEENAKILFTARVAEHLYLVFNSLANKDHALSLPEPMAKIADVAGNSGDEILFSAVGNVMEWDFIVPFYGRHQIVKGAVYAYYEFPSQSMLNDEEWRAQLPNQPFQSWIQPYVTQQRCDDLPRTHY